MYTVIAKYYPSTLIFITVALLNSCGGNSNTSNLPANPTSVSYGGNYHIVQTITEDFEQGHKAAYAPGSVTLKSGKWIFADALTAGSESDYKAGKQAVRIKNNGKISMLFDVEGANSVTIKHAAYGHGGASSWALFVAVNGDKTYKQTGTTITSSSHTLQTVTFNINKTARLRFEIRKLSGGKNRINLDDFTINGTQDIQNEAGTSVSTGDTIVYTKPTSTDSVAANDNDNLLCGNPSGATSNLTNYNN